MKRNRNSEKDQKFHFVASVVLQHDLIQLFRRVVGCEVGRIVG